MLTFIKSSIASAKSIFKPPTLDSVMSTELEQELKTLREADNMIAFMSFQRSISIAKIDAIKNFYALSSISPAKETK